MDQAEKYKELKKRNEQQLTTIRKLGTSVDNKFFDIYTKLYLNKCRSTY